jgi:glycosyltransferase involved in cell wall biosynthesis
MKIVHIITGLNDGGAENILYKICHHDNFNNHIVISIVSGGKYFSLLKKIGIKVYCMDMKFYSLLNFFYLIKLLRNLKPDIVQTWLIHGDFIGGIASRLAGIKNILWTILYSKLDTSIEKTRNILLIKILAKLSYIIPKLIIVVSKSAKKNCQNLGYNKKKIRLITTGFDLSYFKISKYEKLYFKKKIKIKKQTPLIGIVARYHPVKDHINLLHALSILRLKKKLFCCALVGSNMTKKNVILFNEIKKLQLENFVKLLGPKNNIPQVMNGLDVNILCSKSEGFPSVIVEAMACGTPCVVTDVGDSAFIVGKNGWVVPSSNSIQLANTIEKTLSKINKKNWKKRCDQARLRVKNKFGINKMIKYYNLTWSEVYNKE